MKQILKINIGSTLYGTNTANSDVDMGGIFIPDESYVFGLNTSSGVQPFQVLVPGEGLLVELGAYVNTANITSVTVCYG